MRIVDSTVTSRMCAVCTPNMLVVSSWTSCLCSALFIFLSLKKHQHHFSWPVILVTCLSLRFCFLVYKNRTLVIVTLTCCSMTTFILFLKLSIKVQCDLEKDKSVLKEMLLLWETAVSMVSLFGFLKTSVVNPIAWGVRAVECLAGKFLSA